jgi:hypothetical protein
MWEKGVDWLLGWKIYRKFILLPKKHIVQNVDKFLCDLKIRSDVFRMTIWTEAHQNRLFLWSFPILRKSLWQWNPPATSPPNLSIFFYPCKTKMKIGSSPPNLSILFYPWKTEMKIGSWVFWSPKCCHWMLKNPSQSVKKQSNSHCDPELLKMY